MKNADRIGVLHVLNIELLVIAQHLGGVAQHLDQVIENLPDPTGDLSPQSSATDFKPC